MLWPDVEFFNDAKKSLTYSKFMLRPGFAGFLHLPTFLSNVYNICQTPGLCVENWKCAETHISDNYYMINGWNLNLKMKLYRKRASQIRF